MARLMAAGHRDQLEWSLVLAGGENKDFAELAESLNVPCRRVGKTSVFRMAQVLRELRPDIVYFFGRIRTLWWALAARQAGVPTLIGAERSSATQWTDRISRSLDRFVLDGYITNSAIAAETLTNYRVPAENIHVVPQGLKFDDDDSGASATKKTSSASPTIICVANIRPLKGHKLLLEVVKQLQEKYPSLRAVLVGKDLTDGKFFRDMREAGLDDTYTWLGFQSDVRSCLRQADIFVLPSLYREGLPSSILEAMYERLPVVGTRVGGVPELIEHGKTGLVVPPRNPQALREALLKLLQSPELRESFGQAGRIRVEKEFSIEQMVNKHLQAFHQIANHSKRRRRSA